MRSVTPVGIAVERLAKVLPTVQDPALHEELDGIHRLLAGLDPYLEENAGPESEALRGLAEETRRAEWLPPLEPEMVSGHVEGRLLQMLVRATGARRVLEIGMFTGYSALALAEALPEDGRVVACEVDPTAAGIAQRWFDRTPAGLRVDVRLGAAADTLVALSEQGQRFDLVFIDADKASYLDYLNALLDRELLADGALVCVDNTLMQGQPWSEDRPTGNGAAIAAFNRAVAADPRWDQVIVPLRDGVTLIRRADDL